MYRFPSTSEPQTASHEEEYSEILRNESHAARCVACQGVRSHQVPVALVGVSNQLQVVAQEALDHRVHLLRHL